MKKIITAAFTLFVLTTVHAQTPSGTDAAITLADPTVVRPNEVNKKTDPYSVHIKAVRNLYDRYGDANNETCLFRHSHSRHPTSWRLPGTRGTRNAPGRRSVRDLSERPPQRVACRRCRIHHARETSRNVLSNVAGGR